MRDLQRAIRDILLKFHFIWDDNNKVKEICHAAKNKNKKKKFLLVSRYKYGVKVTINGQKEYNLDEKKTNLWSDANIQEISARIDINYFYFKIASYFTSS